MLIDGEIESRLADIRIISELLDAYIDYRVGEKLCWGCVSFLSDSLQKNINEIYTILRN